MVGHNALRAHSSRPTFGTDPIGTAFKRIDVHG
jgi:hypothetical protein